MSHIGFSVALHLTTGRYKKKSPTDSHGFSQIMVALI